MGTSQFKKSQTNFLKHFGVEGENKIQHSKNLCYFRQKGLLICSAEGPTDDPVNDEPVAAEFYVVVAPAAVEPLADNLVGEECLNLSVSDLCSSYSRTVSRLDDSVSLFVKTPEQTRYRPMNTPFSNPHKPPHSSN